jgi:hypothetical protein
MSDDEVVVLLVSGAIGLWGWIRWYWLVLMKRQLGSAPQIRLWSLLAPVICIWALWILLRKFASFDVRESTVYLSFYIVFGAGWLVAGMGLLSIFAISWREDVLEHNNFAAFLVIGGGLAGLTACYGGANFGDGPGWWCVLWAGGLATIAWLVLWIGLIRFFSITERITIDRDLPCGVRQFFYLLASGLICGRGAAGDWTSIQQTAAEFLTAWPVLFLVVFAGLVEYWMPRATTPEKPGVPAIAQSILLGIIYLCFAVVVIKLAPDLPQNPVYGMAGFPAE